MYAPAEGVRYDGVYRIEKCWRAKGRQQHLMCRYLFVRCDNSPAPWSTHTEGDAPRDPPHVDELTPEVEVFRCVGPPAWDYDPAERVWKWMRPPPATQHRPEGGAPGGGTKRKAVDTLAKSFACKLCGNVLNQPTTTPCGHSFCLACLRAAFQSTATVRPRAVASGRAMRPLRDVKPCPACKTDIADFLDVATVNHALALQ